MSEATGSSSKKRGRISEPSIAYFSMEIFLDGVIPTYSGGLGVLAGDLLRTAADTSVPVVGVSLLYRGGYFRQMLDAEGNQTESEVSWKPERSLKLRYAIITVTIEGKRVYVRAWEYLVKGVGGHSAKVFLLDTDWDLNDAEQRKLTCRLYAGDQRYRISQEMILGIGGVRMLDALGYGKIFRYHMNEGHAAFLGLELLDESAREQGRKQFNHDDVEAVRRRCVFTTHTPVPAGQDQFPLGLVKQVLGRPEIFEMREVFCCEGTLNMTYLALNLSHYVNGVAKRHRETSAQLFQPKQAGLHYEIDSITNGVHSATWAARPFQKLFDNYIPDWRKDNFSLRNALRIPPQAVWQAHSDAKKDLVSQANRLTGMDLNMDVLTLGFGRRATAYKRNDLLFDDIERLRALSSSGYPIQVVIAGKAHPADEGGKEAIRRIFKAAKLLEPDVRIVYLPDYGAELAKLMVSGLDVWLNTPEPPLEASGTSGMKAALNGVPSLSILDGWWLEGCVEGVTGWAIDGSRSTDQDRRPPDAVSLYEKLEQTVAPMFYDGRNQFIEVMRHCIALNGSFFNTQRMLQQYVSKAYLC
jgi:starch phosphorylase